ncbi:MAG: Bacteriophage peptidoglycan hydrolase [Xylanivirga thermophila]
MEKYMKKLRRVLRNIIFIVIALLLVNRLILKPNAERHSIDQMYSYLMEAGNRDGIFTVAVALNGGKTINTCVYFVAEALRQNGIPISEGVCNTSQLMSALKERGWKENTNYKDLKSGDIVFTTDAAGNKDGTPTHAYIFMQWVEKGNYGYAYICDNQANDYGGNLYHIRNIKNTDNVNGAVKEAFSFFMRP